MTKTRAKVFMWLNSIFICTNIYFLWEGAAPEINLFAGLVSLGGLIASYLLLKDGEDNHG